MNNNNDNLEIKRFDETVDLIGTKTRVLEELEKKNNDLELKNEDLNTRYINLQIEYKRKYHAYDKLDKRLQYTEYIACGFAILSVILTIFLVSH